MKHLILIDCVLCLLGIISVYTGKFANRKDKTAKISFKYWFVNNWAGFVSSFAFTLGLMIIIHIPGTKIDMENFFKNLPFGFSVLGPPALSFLVGLGFTKWFFYGIFKSKK